MAGTVPQAYRKTVVINLKNKSDQFDVNGNRSLT